MQYTRGPASWFAAAQPLVWAGVIFCHTTCAQGLTLTSHAASHFTVVSRSNHVQGLDWASSELRRYVLAMSGVDLPQREVLDSTGPAIVIGLRLDLSKEEQAALPPPATGFDGYAIAVSEPNEKSAKIIIGAQNGRGAIYAVYDLLERLGCRWCYPTQDPKDPEVVPKRDVFTIEPATWSVASPFRFRICNGDAWFFDMDLDNARRQLDWAMKNRYNAMGWQSESKTTLSAQYERMRSAGLLDELKRRDMLLHGPAHSFDHFLRDADYMKDHPEWFGMRDGKRVPQSFVGAQFCWSNAAARHQFVENVAAFAKASPEINILGIVPFDGGRACACPDCAKSTASDLLMLLMGQVIDRLQAVRPELLVETVGGYGPMSEPPKVAVIHPRQRVIWAHWGRYYGIGYDDPRYDRRDNLEAWRQASRGGITICQYYTDNFAEPWILPPFTHVIKHDRMYFIEKKIDSVYMLMWPPGYWWNHALNGYIAGRCFYDVSLDPFSQIRDYALHYFGERAGPLLASYEEEWARNVDLAYHVKDNASDAEREILAQQRRQWIDPAIAAAKDDPVYSYRVNKVARLHTLAEQLAEMHRGRQEIQHARKAGDFDQASQQLEASRRYVEELLGNFRALADLNQGLMDKNEVPGFITLGLKGWLDEEAKAIAEKKR